MSHSGRMQAAATRAVDCYARSQRVAESLSDELDDVTPVHGVPTTDLEGQDSAVLAIGAAITANEPVEVPKKRQATSPGSYSEPPRSTGK